MRYMGSTHFVIIDKANKENKDSKDSRTEILCGPLEAAQQWCRVFARNHPAGKVSIIKRTTYEYDEPVEYELPENSAPR